MKQHPSTKIIVLFLIIFALISPILAEEPYEEGDEVELEETTTFGLVKSDQTSAAQASKQAFCDDPQRCQNIDQVWFERIGLYINQEHAQHIWDPYSQSWKTFPEVYVPPPPLPSPSFPSQTPTSFIDNHIKFPGSSKCFSQALSQTQAEAKTKVVSVQFQGHTIEVNKLIKPLIEKINKEITAANIPQSDFKSVQTGSWRYVRSPKINVIDDTTCLTTKGKIARSKHSYQVAIDINPTENEFCSIGPDGKYYYKGTLCKPTILSQVVTIFKNNDFRWGGDWTGAKDYMHFDWQGNIGDFDDDPTTIEQCGQPSQPKTPPQSSPTYDLSTIGTILTKQANQVTIDNWKTALTFQQLQGISWIGKIDSNGKDDNFLLPSKGRETIIFLPTKTDINKPVDILYFFHGLGGFSIDMQERITPQIKKISDSGHNIILVFPELPWSQGTGAFDNKDNPRTTEGLTDHTREYQAWDGTDSNLKQFHADIKTIISKEMTGGKFTPGRIIMLGHSNGGSALAVAAEQGALNAIKPDIITLSDADYIWQGKSPASTRIWVNYLKTHPSTQFNLVVQSPTENPKNQPTKNALAFAKNTLNNPIDGKTQIILQQQNPLVRYKPVTSQEIEQLGTKQYSTRQVDLHNHIARMSLAWTIENSQPPANS